MADKNRPIFKLTFSEKFFDFYQDAHGTIFKYEGIVGKHVRLKNIDKNCKDFNLEIRVLVTTFRKTFKPLETNGNNN